MCERDRILTTSDEGFCWGVPRREQCVQTIRELQARAHEEGYGERVSELLAEKADS